MASIVGDVAALASADAALASVDVAPSVCVCVFPRACVCVICAEATTSTEAPIVFAAAIHQKLVSLAVAVVSF